MELWSLPGSCLFRGDPSLGSVGSMVGLMENSKRACTKSNIPGLLLLVPLSLWWAPDNSHLQRSLSNTSRWFWFSLLWGHYFFPLGLGVCALQDWSLCFPQACGNPTVKSCWSSSSDSLGIPSPFTVSSGWEAWCGVMTFTTVGEIPWYCSPVCGSWT